jgi:hypothetical protein
MLRARESQEAAYIYKTVSSATTVHCRQARGLGQGVRAEQLARQLNRVARTFYAIALFPTCF